MAAKRKSLSKKFRFEVFKRDGFRCSYCGRTPPEAILHVDHVIPVSEGGSDKLDNLVTACDACNLGKSNISLAAVPRALVVSAKELREREEQLREYQALLLAKRDRLEEEMWKIAAELEEGGGETYRRDWLQSIKQFLERLGFYSVLDAAEKARAWHPYGGRRTFLYFCGICWKRIRGEGTHEGSPYG